MQKKEAQFDNILEQYHIHMTRFAILKSLFSAFETQTVHFNYF